MPMRDAPDTRPTTACIHGVATVPESWAGLALYDATYQDAMEGDEP